MKSFYLRLKFESLSNLDLFFKPSPKTTTKPNYHGPTRPNLPFPFPFNPYNTSVTWYNNNDNTNNVDNTIKPATPISDHRIAKKFDDFHLSPHRSSLLTHIFITISINISSISIRYTRKCICFLVCEVVQEG